MKRILIILSLILFPVVVFASQASEDPFLSCEINLFEVEAMWITMDMPDGPLHIPNHTPKTHFRSQKILSISSNQCGDYQVSGKREWWRIEVSADMSVRVTRNDESCVFEMDDMLDAKAKSGEVIELKGPGAISKLLKRSKRPYQVSLDTDGDGEADETIKWKNDVTDYLSLSCALIDTPYLPESKP